MYNKDSDVLGGKKDEIFLEKGKLTLARFAFQEIKPVLEEI